MDDQQAWARFEALGSLALVAVTDPAQLAAARTEVEQTVATFDLACSRFRDDSELTALNAASGMAVPVSDLLLEAVGAALRAAQATDGDVDPTIGEALIALGYDRDFSAIEAGGRSRSPVTIAAVRGWRTVEVDREARTVRLPRAVRLDLGASAKALAADRSAERARAVTGCGVLVSLGGDIATAGQTPEDGWRVRVTDDHRAELDAPGQWIAIRTGGLATSSTIVRRWRTGDGVAHHLIDPATSRPAGGAWRTVTVAAASCLDANIASTASIIRGQRAVAWLESLGLPSRLVDQQGVACHLAGWPSEGDDLGPQREGCQTTLGSEVR